MANVYATVVVTEPNEYFEKKFPQEGRQIFFVTPTWVPSGGMVRRKSSGARHSSTS